MLSTPNLKIEQISHILQQKISKLEKETEHFKNCIYEDMYLIQDACSKISAQGARTQANEQFQVGRPQRQAGRASVPEHYLPPRGDQPEAEEEDEDEDRENLMRTFSMLNTVKCMEGLDKLMWFKKMKTKADFKKYQAP